MLKKRFLSILFFIFYHLLLSDSFRPTKEEAEDDEDTSKYDFGIINPSASEKLTKAEAEQILRIQKSQT